MEALSTNLAYRHTLRFRLRGASLVLLSSIYHRLYDREQDFATPRVHIFALHHVLPDEEALFRDFLQQICRTHTTISYLEAVKRIQHGPIDRPYVTFSFDDGVSSCLSAARILDEFGASACFFVVPTFVGAIGANAQKYSAALGLPLMSFMSWDHLEQLKLTKHEIGAHTMTHKNLALCSDQELADEVGHCRETLIERLGESLHFAWPFGRQSNFSPRAHFHVIKAGFFSCASGMRGCYRNPMPEALHLLWRESVPAYQGTQINLFFMQHTIRNLTNGILSWPAPNHEDF
ncbi:MAG TPA: polysaccharide deacetylase family protein [Aggregatilineaceae bacterium]|nr:polysaccharide deacetylase family protein [Aggregatilineaceae bacterium]